MLKIERRSASAAAPAAIQSEAGVTLSASPLFSLAVPEDVIVAEFLLRLPIKALFRFKCLSKRYESIISNPEFGKIYLQRAQSCPELWASSGLVASSLLFPLTPTYVHCLSNNVKDLSHTCNNQDDQLPVSVCSVSLPNNEQHEIRAFSNGLMLSVIYRPPCSRAEKCGTFFLRVSNPLTKQCVPIPESTLCDYMDLLYCISTRLAYYKIVLIEYMNDGIFVEDNTNATVAIFSSDTGSWVSREVSGFPGDFSCTGTVQANFAHRGVLHWLGRTTGMVITYDPYDNPHRFGRIRLPSKNYSSWRYGSLIYSGDEEMVKYCEMDPPGRGKSDVVRLKVWRLVDSEEWCIEGEFSFPSLPRLCKRLLLAPNPWNRDVVCHPYVIDKSVMVINLCTGSWKLVNVVDAAAPEPVLCFVGRFYKCWPLIPLELSPWSSPFYGQRG